jgi:hypothetical protein
MGSTSCCAVCIGSRTPTGWFREEIERALNRQAADPSFRVIPVLMPDADSECISPFLELRTWADFRPDQDPDYAVHTLVCGVRGVPVGRWTPRGTPSAASPPPVDQALRRLRELLDQQLIHDDVAIEYERLLVAHMLEPWMRVRT